jgi:hypothetical protein
MSLSVIPGREISMVPKEREEKADFLLSNTIGHFLRDKVVTG